MFGEVEEKSTRVYWMWMFSLRFMMLGDVRIEKFTCSRSDAFLVPLLINRFNTKNQNQQSLFHRFCTTTDDAFLDLQACKIIQSISRSHSDRVQKFCDHIHNLKKTKKNKIHTLFVEIFHKRVPPSQRNISPISRMPRIKRIPHRVLQQILPGIPSYNDKREYCFALIPFPSASQLVFRILS